MNLGILDHGILYFAGVLPRVYTQYSCVFRLRMLLTCHWHIRYSFRMVITAFVTAYNYGTAGTLAVSERIYQFESTTGITFLPEAVMILFHSHLDDCFSNFWWMCGRLAIR